MVKKNVSVSLLLPPSEGKATGGRGRWDPHRSRVPAFGALGDRREQVAAALAAAGGGDEKLLGVGGAHLLRAQSANAALLGAPVLPAGERYTGVVWDHLDLAGLPPEARRRASASIAVVSGLLGVVSVDDPVPDYRLKMGASLAPLGRLATWWRPAVTDAIDTWARRRFVVDLLPNEHRAAWAPDGASRLRGVSVSFVERNGKVAGHDAKAAKGRLARHVLLFDGHPLDALGAWSDERFDLHVVPL